LRNVSVSVKRYLRIQQTNSKRKNAKRMKKVISCRENNNLLSRFLSVRASKVRPDDRIIQPHDRNEPMKVGIFA
ncbi:hypothetical protein QCN27_18430, partial [Cereibacter sp. SYSU M97828]|nr:hypothetical protein [Cereibacter flavus]